jgi:phosphoribosylformylglycinamidine synthase
MMRVRVAVLRFPGTWSERDFAHALTVAGAEAEIVWHGDADLAGYDAAIVPGGFAYGDYLRAGAIAKISPAAAELRRAAAAGMPILGSCNGFQILCEIGLLPGALVRNRGLEFRCDWVTMRVEQDGTPFTTGLRGDLLRMPIAHGEGCWVADAPTVAAVEERGQVVFRYVDDRGAATLEANPNGSTANIAGLSNERGNVVGLMPHPERCSEALLGGTDGLRVLVSLTAQMDLNRAGRPGTVSARV